MTRQPKHSEITAAIDLHLSGDNFNAVSRTPGHKYERWYATLLSTIALLVAEEEVVYAHTDYEPGMEDARIVVFTTNLVVLADVDLDLDGVPVAHVAPRRSLAGMKLSASERIDARDGRSYTWPGNLNLVLTYSGLPSPIEIIAAGANPFAVDQAAPIVTLIEGLSRDLARTAPTNKD